MTFRSKKSRNKFLDNDDWHFVKENDKAPFEKLKVSPWYEKPNKKQNLKPLNRVPLYKSDLEKETQDPNNLSYEDFSRNTSDTSIQSFRGRIKNYISGGGSVGDIEIRVSGARARGKVIIPSSISGDDSNSGDFQVRCACAGGQVDVLQLLAQCGAEVTEARQGQYSPAESNG